MSLLFEMVLSSLDTLFESLSVFALPAKLVLGISVNLLALAVRIYECSASLDGNKYKSV